METVVIVGLGSMGKRRTRIIKKLYPDIQIIGVDLEEQRCDDFSKEFTAVVSQDLLEVCQKYKPEAAIVATSPLSHAGIVAQCLKAGLHVFTEINLSTKGYVENIELAKTEGKELFISSTFLYRKELSYIREKIKVKHEPLNYIYHVGQYLPDWHPWEDYRNFFVAKKESNACRELFAIELPWIIAAFGDIVSLSVISDNMSGLELAYPDNYIVTLRHSGGHKGVLVVDVVSREAVRDFVVLGESVFLKWDGTPLGLYQKNLKDNLMENINLYDGENIIHDSNYSKNVIENAYENEVKAFMDAVNRHVTPVYTYEDDMKTLAWIDKIEAGTNK